MTRLIQVGMGGMGDVWLRTVRGSDVAEHAAFVEINSAMAERQCAAYDIPRSLVFPTLREALAAQSAGGVIVVSPPQFHREQSVQALEAGLPVLSEKPLADSMEAARVIVEASDRTGQVHMVAQNYRYSTPIRTLRQALSAPELGTVGSASVRFFRGPHFGGFREEMAYPLVVDMSIHHFDLMRYLLGRDLTSARGISFNPPWSWFRGDASAVLALDLGGIPVGYEASWCSQGAETTWNGDWRIECENGVIVMEGDQVRRQLVGHEMEEVPRVQPKRVAQDYLLHEFVAAITGGPLPATRCQDNLRSLEMVFTVLAAAAV